MKDQKEYEEALSTIRHYSNLRFAELSLFSAITGGLMSLAIKYCDIGILSMFVSILGVLVSIIFIMLEVSVRKYIGCFKQYIRDKWPDSHILKPPGWANNLPLYSFMTLYIGALALWIALAIYIALALGGRKRKVSMHVPNSADQVVNTHLSCPQPCKSRHQSSHPPLTLRLSNGAAPVYRASTLRPPYAKKPNDVEDQTLTTGPFQQASNYAAAKDSFSKGTAEWNRARPFAIRASLVYVW
jgi:hypothetical protein